jgi:hypothetical protein
VTTKEKEGLQAELTKREARVAELNALPVMSRQQAWAAGLNMNQALTKSRRFQLAAQSERIAVLKALLKRG